MQQNDDITFKMVQNNKTGMVSPPKEASKIINNTDFEVHEIFRNEISKRLFIHLKEAESGMIKSFEVVDLPKDHHSSYAVKKYE